MPTALSLSVLLPVYAGAQPDHFAAALDSLATQTRPADEVVIVEDGPLPEAHRRILAEASSRLSMRRLALPSQSGLGNALSAGLDAVAGNWVARMDADDIAVPERFAVQLEAVDRLEIDVLGTAMSEFDTDPSNPVALRRMPTTHEAIARTMRHLNPINHPTVLFRTEAARSAGGYRPLEGLEDYDLWARMLVAGSRFHNLPDALVLFRADAAMLHRRRRPQLFRAELALQRNLHRYGIVNRHQGTINLVVRNAARLLPPPLMRTAIRRLVGSSADQCPRGPRLSADEVRQIQLKLLDEFAAYCTREGLQWSLFGGTLLGAARHQGYIPWDDDIDVSMPRAHFELFCRTFQSTRFDRSLAWSQRQSGYWLPYAKYCDNTTIVREYYQPMPRYGVHIDIFPIDAWPDSRLRARALTIAMLLLRGLLGVRVVPARAMTGTLRRVATRLARPPARVIRPATITRMITALASRHRGPSAQSGLIVWGRPNAVPSDVFASTTPLRFEEHEYPAPVGWQTWLESNYGDYLTPPPEGEQVSNHRWSAYRVDKS